MAGNKHPKSEAERQEGPGGDVPRPPSDLDRDPGIGSSKGTFAGAPTPPPSPGRIPAKATS